jgi:hypothetical protein
MGQMGDDEQDRSEAAGGSGGGLTTNAAEHPTKDKKTALAMVRFMADREWFASLSRIAVRAE